MEKRMPVRVVFTGPESTGKTTLATRLAADTGWPMVPEYARNWLENKSSYTETDVYRMALGQYASFHEALQQKPPGLIADTDLLTYRIWLMTRYGHVSQWLIDLHRRQQPVHYLLCVPDLPWQADPLRENQHDRNQLFEAYHELILAESLPFTIIKGIDGERYLNVRNSLGVKESRSEGVEESRRF